jgi:YggT family protein
VLGIIATIIQLYILLIFARAIGSMFVRDWSTGIPRFLYEITEPVLAPVRRFIPPIGGVLDISPMVVAIGLQVLLSVIVPGGGGGLGLGI